MTAPLTWAMSGRLRQGSWGGCGSVEGMQEKHRNHDSRTSRLRNSPHNRPEHHPITGIGHERVRAMIYGPVATSRIAYRKKGKENLYPQDAGLNSAGWRGHRRGVRRSAPPRLRSPAAVVRRGGRQQPPDRDHHHARRGLPGQGAHPDRPHSCDEYLWKAANSFFYPGDPAARAWVKDQTAKILAGKHRDVRAGIRRRATTYSYSPAERAAPTNARTTFEHKQDYLDYPAFLAAGWPVASGLIEGAARWIVKDRLELTGARWGLDGAEAVLKLRALHGTGDLGDYLDYHFPSSRPPPPPVTVKNGRWRTDRGRRPRYGGRRGNPQPPGHG